MRKHSGVTLIELAVVLIVVGVLLGSLLKGREMITNAHVRKLLSQQEAIKSAYFGFYDRYRALPGDYSQAVANIAGVSGCGGNGNGNGLIENAAGSPASVEHILVWEHLSKAGFIVGRYNCNSTESLATTPSSLYGGRIQLAFDSQYASLVPGSPGRHNLKTGSQISSEILAEMDRKADDGSAARGSMRFSDYDSGTGAPDPAKCFQPVAPYDWIATIFEGNCGATSLL